MKRQLLILALLLNTLLSSAQSKLIHQFAYDQYGGPSKSVQSGNKLFFTAYDSIHGRELWCTDGTSAGTYMVKDINPGINNSMVDYFEYLSLDLNGIIYFRANDGITGNELWRSDGTDTGTYLVADIAAGASSSNVGEFTATNNLLFFTANTGTSVWRSDGTTAGTYSVGSFQVATSLYGWNGNLYFSADNNNSGQELWKSNGTAVGTHLLKDLNGVFGASLPCNFHATSNALYFMANTAYGWELWKTTGSTASTTLVKDINPAGANGVLDFYSEAKMVNIDDILYFRAQDGSHGYQLWKSDGTAAGTVMLSNLPDGIDSYSTFPIVKGKILVNNYAINNFWAYDPAVTTTLPTAYPSDYSFNNNPDRFIFIDSTLYYAGKDSIYGCEIWLSDGTVTGNKLMQETNLTDNWFAASSQGFNKLFGKLNTTLLFTLARTAYNTNIPLYVYDAGNPQDCNPPSVIEPVPLSYTTAHFVWNRTENTTAYELRYRIAGTVSWSSINTNYSFTALNNLLANTDYEYQLKADCNGSWTAWSDTGIYNSSFSGFDYAVNIIAERSENSSTERIYWLKTAQIVNLQIRYRPFGTSSWYNTFNTTGYKRITGLVPNTFYEYQYRANDGVAWAAWYPNSRYFFTDSTTSTVLNDLSEENFIIYPNPSNDKIYFSKTLAGKTSFIISDATGRNVQSGILHGNAIEISSLANGIYQLQLRTANHTCNKLFLKN